MAVNNRDILFDHQQRMENTWESAWLLLAKALWESLLHIGAPVSFSRCEDFTTSDCRSSIIRSTYNSIPPLPSERHSCSTLFAIVFPTQPRTVDNQYNLLGIQAAINGAKIMAQKRLSCVTINRRFYAGVASFGVLKRASPAPVTVLVPAYTAPLANACPWVDEVIIDPGSQADKAAQQALLFHVKQSKFDALLTLFSTPRIGWLA